MVQGTRLSQLGVAFDIENSNLGSGAEQTVGDCEANTRGAARDDRYLPK